MKLDKTYPNDYQIEKSLIASLILNRGIFDEIMDLKITPEDFYDRRIGIIYKSIFELYKSNMPIDYITVNSKLTATNQIEAIGGGIYLTTLVDEHVTTVNAYGYAVAVKEFSTLRNIITTSLKIANDGFQLVGPIPDFVRDVETAYFRITTQNKINKLFYINTLLKENLRELENSDRKIGEIDGLSTGFAELDKYLLGLRAGQLIIIGARPGMGKSALALNIAYNICHKHKLPVIFFSLEMAATELSMRMLTTVAKVDGKRIRSKNYQEYDLRKISIAIKEMGSIPFYIDESSAVTLMEITSICRKKKSEEGLGLIVIDYLGLMGTNKSIPREQQIAEITRGLKSLAKDLECPIIALSQLNRESESGTAAKAGNKRPVSSNLRESGAIEADADAILLIYRDDYYNKDSKQAGIAEVIVTKNRAGEQGTALLSWVGSYTSFENLSSQNKN